MKKRISLLTFLLPFFFSARAQGIDTLCKAPPRSTLIGYQDVVRFTSNYHNNHYGSLENHTKALYINDTAILFLDRFFNHGSYTKYFGFCLYLVNYNVKKNPHQRESDQTYIYLTPVHDAIDSLSDFEVLDDFYQTVKHEPLFRKMNKLDNAIPCYGTCDSSINKWVWKFRPQGIKSDRLKSDVLNEPSRNDIFLLSKDRTDHETNRENYVTDQGRELYDLQTQRIYFDKLTIQRLAGFIKSGNATKYPMIGLYFISYNDLKQPSQGHPNQTTVALIPMRKMSNGALEPDPCAYVSYFNQRKNQKDKLFMVAENHGTLCPTQCPNGGN